ncbi:hypothetical protein [Leptolyngbya sp. FACHB-16]|jgi:hypothetical protein|uniref:hypothetical protein n=1 Tax=unclassified Leptolyngbya TaxID=2650499 RepID=UPI0016861BC4|nr:hypothetical protein [Leptolyngbya sp. FACHB-16]MBD2157273.1 hypothetical protein [Leptolyngbya sp. FACHB-16]
MLILDVFLGSVALYLLMKRMSISRYISSMGIFTFNIFAYRYIIASESKAQRSIPQAQSDPLIDYGGEVAVYIGAVLFILIIAAIVGFFSRRFEHALITAFSLSFVLLVLFAFSR